MRDQQYQDYRFRCKRRSMRARDIARLLDTTYWAKGRSRKDIRKHIRHSLPYGIFTMRGEQVGFARVITDFSTTFYLADVVVREDLRGKGLGRAFMAYVLSDSRFSEAKGVLLTRTAFEFYKHFGFALCENRCMLRERSSTLQQDAGNHLELTS